MLLVAVVGHLEEGMDVAAAGDGIGHDEVVVAVGKIVSADAAEPAAAVGEERHHISRVG